MTKLTHFVRLEELASFMGGSTPSRRESRFFGGGIPWVKTTDLNNGLITLTEETLTPIGLESSSCRLIPANAVLVAMYGGFRQIGRTGLLTKESAINQALTAILPDASKLLPMFLLQWLNFRVDYWKRFAASSRKDPNITKTDVADFPVPCIPVAQQREVCRVFEAWNIAIEKTGLLIAAKTRCKRALMQQLLMGRHRQSGHTSWKSVRLSEVAEEQSMRNEVALDRSRLYAVTKAAGMVPMRERVQGATTHRCKLVERGWFAYNPMRVNVGSIARWEERDPVMVSGDYVVFRTDEEQLLSNYLNHVRQSAEWADFVGASGSGSVRIRIWFEDLGRFKFPLPSLKEQRAIANFLDTCDEELQLLRAGRAALEQQKRGLMQRLLTGKVRVKT